MKIINPKTFPYQLQLEIVSNALRGKNPEYIVQVNGINVEPVEILRINDSQEKHRYSHKVESLRTIKISLLNKSDDDTIVVGGDIVDDLYIKIEKLLVDKINLTAHINQISHYHNDREFKNTTGYIGANGTLTIKIHSGILYTDIVCSLLE